MKNRTSKNIITAADQVVKAVNQELMNLALCPECYEKASIEPVNSFLMPCKTPHILLWVNFSNYGYWPAKLMKRTGNNKVIVRFFGDYTYSDVSPSKCLIFSRVSREWALCGS